MRAIALLAVVIGALVALLWARPARPIDPALPQLAYVTTAHQLGVVGYRDPAGAISPDGKRFAYSEGRFIRVIPIGGGAPITLPPADWPVESIPVIVIAAASLTEVGNGVVTSGRCVIEPISTLYSRA